jgi:hypothetical protein
MIVAAHNKIEKEIIEAIVVKNPNEALAVKIDKYWDQPGGSLAATDAAINKIFRGYVEGS